MTGVAGFSDVRFAEPGLAGALWLPFQIRAELDGAMVREGNTSVRLTADIDPADPAKGGGHVAVGPPASQPWTGDRLVFWCFPVKAAFLPVTVNGGNVTWNVLGTSMTLVPFITFVLEGIAIFFILILVLVYIVSRPELMAQVEQFSGQIYLLDETDPEQLIGLVAPLLLRPDVMAVVLLLFSVVVPLVEELVKPLGVWLFGGQIRSPAQGFALGALGGAAFAIIETLAVSPQSEDWSILLLTRLGTDVLHVTTSALMGAGIVYAIHQRRYLRFSGTYGLLRGRWPSSGNWLPG